MNGSLRYSGTGYWIVNSDMNSPYSVESIVPEVTAAMPTAKDCEKELYCGFPYLMPVTTFLWYVYTYTYCLKINVRTEKVFFIRKTSWIPGPAPLISVPTNLELISKTRYANVVLNQQYLVNFTFYVTGICQQTFTFNPLCELWVISGTLVTLRARKLMKTAAHTSIDPIFFLFA